MSKGTARGAVAVTPHDDNAVSADALYIGVTGDVTVRPRDRSADVTFKAHPVGYLLLQVTHVRATGTTATNILALNL